MENNRLKTLDEIAEAVAYIPYEPPIVAPQFGNQAFLLNQNEHLLASWKTKGKCPGGFATETFMKQVASPSTMLVRRRGSLIEHAIFLCSLFRGKNVNAFVALGEVKHRPYAWVLTIIHRSDLESYFGSNSGLIEEQWNKRNRALDLDSIEYKEDSETVLFRKQEFLKSKQVKEEAEFVKDHVVIHWDPLTGNWFTADEDGKVPFDVLTTIFNEKNQYFNVQLMLDPSQY
jgi:hypothetical protein